MSSAVRRAGSTPVSMRRRPAASSFASGLADGSVGPSRLLATPASAETRMVAPAGSGPNRPAADAPASSGGPTQPTLDTPDRPGGPNPPAPDTPASSGPNRPAPDTPAGPGAPDGSGSSRIAADAPATRSVAAQRSL